MKRFLSFSTILLLLGVAFAGDISPKLDNTACDNEGIYFKVRAGHTGDVKLWIQLEVMDKDSGYRDYAAVFVSPGAYTIWTVSNKYCDKYKLSLWQDFNDNEQKLIGKLDETEWRKCKK